MILAGPDQGGRPGSSGAGTGTGTPARVNPTVPEQPAAGVTDEATDRATGQATDRATDRPIEPPTEET